MSLTTSTPDAPETQDIDPQGDIIFVLGNPRFDPEPRRRLRVSSKILSLASPAFAAMFSPRWDPPRGDKDPSLFGIPREITLPDDDVEAMTRICQMLHFREEASSDVSLDLLEMIAMICDKYNLVTALKPWIGLTLQLRIPLTAPQDENSLASMMFAASVIDNQDIFWRCSMFILYSCPGKSPGRDVRVTPTVHLFSGNALGMSI